MRSRRIKTGFTLLELILVMGIIVLMATMVAPALRGFGVGRKTNNAGRQIVGLAHYARTQAIAEGRVYRLNFDTKAHTFWLTLEDDTGVYVGAPNDMGDPIPLPDGVTMDLQITAQTNVQMDIPSTVQQQVVPGPASITQPGIQPNPLMQNVRADGQTYVEFQPSGRTDPTQIKLTDSLGGVVEIICPTVMDQFRLLLPGEMTP